MASSDRARNLAELEQREAEAARRKQEMAARLFSSRPAKTPDQLLAMQRDEKARAIPESEFAGDESLQAMRARMELTADVLAQWWTLTPVIQEKRAEIQAQIEMAQTRAAWMALECVLRGGDESAWQMAAWEIDKARACRDVLDAALRLMQAPYSVPHALKAAAESAARAHGERLHALCMSRALEMEAMDETEGGGNA